MKTNHFVGAIYFNVDYTNGLTLPLLGEADWAIINTTIGKFYEGFWHLYSSSKSDFSSLLALFGLEKIEINSKEQFVPQFASKDLKQIEALINQKFIDQKEKSDFYTQLLTSPSGKKSFDKAVEILAEEYVSSNK